MDLPVRPGNKKESFDKLLASQRRRVDIVNESKDPVVLASVL